MKRTPIDYLQMFIREEKKKRKNHIYLLYLHVFLKALRGDAVGPLAVTDDPLFAVRKLFGVRGEKYQIRYGQYGAGHPNADGYHEGRLPAQPGPQRMNNGNVPATRKNIKKKYLNK